MDVITDMEDASNSLLILIIYLEKSTTPARARSG
jgi:hypothetical protein